MTWSGPLVTAAAGEYRLCWCGRRGGAAGAPECRTGEDFTREIASVTLAGPFAGHERTCVAGQQCRATGLRGVGLTTDDQWLVLDTCGVTSQAVALLFQDSSSHLQCRIP